MLSSLTINDILSRRLLRPVFQPIAALANGAVGAHEVLIRGPKGSELELPNCLFAAADEKGLRTELELLAVECALSAIQSKLLPGQFFINISGRSALTLIAQRGIDFIVEWLQNTGINLSSLTFEITEHERVEDIEQFKMLTDRLCAKGVSFALDDFGDGHSSLRLWSELQPRYVKIDKFFIADLDTKPHKIQTLKALVHISEILGGTLIAEGIETEKQLSLVRDQGIALGQGYFLGRPQEALVQTLAAAAMAAIADDSATLVTHSSFLGPRGITADRLLISAPYTSPNTLNSELFDLFQANPNIHALPVVENGTPVGLINRRDFIEQYSRKFQRELLGNKPCSKLMNCQPKVLERSANIDQMIEMLTSADQRFLADGIIITENQKYLGVGTGEQLVRAVTEQRLEAARHANPLTFLPGNIPISQHIDKLLKSGRRFYTAYCDLNHFKPFNDQYGYWRGDEMIRMLSKVLLASVDNSIDFVGHVGGDDFIMIFQSDNAVERCQKAIDVFNAKAQTLFDQEEITRGGIESEDRSGNMGFFPLTTLSIGVAKINPQLFKNSEDVANRAALAKRYAKKASLGLWVGESAAELNRAYA